MSPDTKLTTCAVEPSIIASNIKYGEV